MGERMLSFLVILGVAVAGYLGLPLVVILSKGAARSRCGCCRSGSASVPRF